jgi:hypothetical protein
MPIWTFMDFLEANGSNPIRTWFVDEILEGARATIDDRILRMEIRRSSISSDLIVRSYRTGRQDKEINFRYGHPSP